MIREGSTSRYRMRTKCYFYIYLAISSNYYTELALALDTNHQWENSYLISVYYPAIRGSFDTVYHNE